MYLLGCGNIKTKKIIKLTSLILFILIILLLFSFLITKKKFIPTNDEIKKTKITIQNVDLNQALKQDKKVLKANEQYNNKGAKDTIISFIKGYNVSNIEASKYLKDVPNFLRLDYFEPNVLNSYKGTEKEELAKEAIKSRIYKNREIYNLVKDIKIDSNLIDYEEQKGDYDIYSVNLTYTDLTHNINDISDLIVTEKDPANLIKFFKNNKTRKKGNFKVCIYNDKNLGFRIDLSKPENYDLISALTGNLSKFTLK